MEGSYDLDDIRSHMYKKLGIDYLLVHIAYIYSTLHSHIDTRLQCLYHSQNVPFACEEFLMEYQKLNLTLEYHYTPCAEDMKQSIFKFHYNSQLTYTIVGVMLVESFLTP